MEFEGSCWLKLRYVLLESWIRQEEILFFFGYFYLLPDFIWNFLSFIRFYEKFPHTMYMLIWNFLFINFFWHLHFSSFWHLTFEFLGQFTFFILNNWWSKILIMNIWFLTFNTVCNHIWKYSFIIFQEKHSLLHFYSVLLFYHSSRKISSYTLIQGSC